MFKRRKLDILVVTIFGFLLSLNGYIADSRRGQQNRNSQRRSNQNSQTNHPEASLPVNLQEAYMNAVDAQQSSQQTLPTTSSMYNPNTPRRGNRERNPWGIFAPSIPTLENSDCFVSVEQYQRGRCTQLGGAGDNRPYICQSGERFEFQADCEMKILERQYRNPHI